MKIRLIGTTVDYTLLERIVERCQNGEELKTVLEDKPFLKVNYDRMGGTAAGICYMPEDFDTLANEKESKTLKRAENTKVSGHHSTHGHVHLNLIIEDCPKIVAMFLNNEKEYTTSEKSARYTKMTPTLEEAQIYSKWVELLKPLIREERPKATDKQIEKLAMENARYMISVFTPTTLEYTTSYRQINYIYNWAKSLCDDYLLVSDFYVKLRGHLSDFCDQLEELGVIDPNLVDQKRKHFSLDVNSSDYDNQFNSSTYSTIYKGSFAYLGQAHRHRSISYNADFRTLSENKFFIPEILSNDDSGYLLDLWEEDMKKLAKNGNFPQGMTFDIVERGTIEAFILKCQERLCSAAQYEIDQLTRNTLSQYAYEIKEEGDYHLSENQEMILKMNRTQGPRCMFGYKCATPCGNVRRGKI